MQHKSDLPKNQYKEIVALLSTLLSDLQVLYVKTLNCHWNVEDPRFASLHLFFEGQYKQLAEFGDMVAERMRALGARAPATLSEYLKLTTLKEMKGQPSGNNMLKELADDYDSLIVDLRKGVKKSDDATTDLLIEILRAFDKTLWMIRSHF